MLILACRLFLHTANNALLGINSFEELTLNITSGSVKQLLKPVDSVYVRLCKMTAVVSVILRGNFETIRVSNTHTYIYKMMQPLAQMMMKKCNGVVLRLQNIQGKTKFSWCSNNKFQISVFYNSSASQLYSHFSSCESCTKEVASSADTDC